MIDYEDTRAERLLKEGWRPVCSRRARKLRKRMEDVRWFPDLNSYAWLPYHIPVEVRFSWEDRSDMHFNTERDEWEIECCRCGRWCPVSDYDFDDEAMPEEGRHYGGCSERCIP